MPETSLCSFLCQRQLCRTDWMSKRVSQVSLILLHCGRCRSIQLTTGSTATLSQGHSQGQVILQWILSCFLADSLWTKNLQAGKETVFFACCYLPSKYFILRKQNVELFLQFLLLLWRFSPRCDSQYEGIFFCHRLSCCHVVKLFDQLNWNKGLSPPCGSDNVFFLEPPLNVY